MVSSEISGGGGGGKGREPGILWGWRGTGHGRRKGGKRERIQKGKLVLLLIIKSKKHTQQRPRLKTKFYTREKSKNENSYSG